MKSRKTMKPLGWMGVYNHLGEVSESIDGNTAFPPMTEVHGYLYGGIL